MGNVFLFYKTFPSKLSLSLRTTFPIYRQSVCALNQYVCVLFVHAFSLEQMFRRNYLHNIHNYYSGKSLRCYFVKVKIQWEFCFLVCVAFSSVGIFCKKRTTSIYLIWYVVLYSRFCKNTKWYRFLYYYFQYKNLTDCLT